jgi:hypothetical protein
MTCYLIFVFLIIGETKTLLFSKSTIGGKILWKSSKVVEGSQGPISYHWILCQILGIVESRIEAGEGEGG